MSNPALSLHWVGDNREGTIAAGLRMLRTWAGASVGTLLIACAPPARLLSIAPKTTLDSLTFVVSDNNSASPSNAPVYGLSVVKCGTEESVWTIAAEGDRLLPSRIRYGQAVPGFPVKVGPAPLLPGCYEAIATGARPARFEVDAHGTVRARSSAP